MAFQARLYGEFRVEIPCIDWNGGHYIRLSLQGYNTVEDIESLLRGLEHLLARRAV